MHDLVERETGEAKRRLNLQLKNLGQEPTSNVGSDPVQCVSLFLFSTHVVCWFVGFGFGRV